jgi:hypothetical protein
VVDDRDAAHRRRSLRSGASRDVGGLTTPPAEGERRAIRGYRGQYLVGGVLILAALDHDLEWIRVADPTAGRVDDFQIASPGRLDAYQVKWSRSPEFVPWSRLKALLGQLAEGWTRLSEQHRERRVVVHVVTNDFPSLAPSDFFARNGLGG